MACLLAAACGSSSGPGNRTPIAAASAPASVEVGDPVTLDGTGSSDPDGDTLAYAWTLVEAPAGSVAAIENAGQRRASFVADVAGGYAFSLRVSDPSGASDSARVDVGALPPPDLAPRIVSLQATPSDPEPGDTVTWSWQVIDTPGSPVPCQLDIEGDGVAEASIEDCLTQTSVDVVYAHPGEYLPNLVALDGDGNSAELFASLFVDGDPWLIPFEPEADSFSGATLEFRLLEYAIGGLFDTITASIADRELALTGALEFVPGGSQLFYWRGAMDLTGLPKVPYVVRIEMLDNQGRYAYIYRRVHYDEAPALSVTSPVEGQYVTADMNVSATCTDVESAQCEIRLVGGHFSPTFTSVDEFDMDFDLSGYEAWYAIVDLVATDDVGNSTTVRTLVNTEANGRVSIVAVRPGDVTDFRDSRVLYEVPIPGAQPYGPHDLGIYRLDNGEVELLPTDFQFTSERLVDGGVVAAGRQRLDPDYYAAVSQVYLWRDGTLTQISSTTIGPYSLQVEGDYVVWAEPLMGGPNPGPAEVMRHRLSTGETVLVGSTDLTFFGREIDLDAEGTVYFVDPDANIAVYRDGAVELITHDGVRGSAEYDGPIGDGHGIAFCKEFGDPPTLWWRDQAGSLTQLAELKRINQITRCGPGSTHEVSGRWAAYHSDNNIWTRAPDGVLIRMTDYPPYTGRETITRLGALSESGEIMYSSSRPGTDMPRLMTVAQGGESQPASYQRGDIIRRDGAWYVLADNTLLRID